MLRRVAMVKHKKIIYRKNKTFRAPNVKGMSVSGLSLLQNGIDPRKSAWLKDDYIDKYHKKGSLSSTKKK